MNTSMEAKFTVIAVDDEADNLELVERTLNKYRVLIFTDAEDAIAAAVQEAPLCMIVDYRMPKMNGVEFIRACRKQGVDTTALMVTAYPELDEVIFAEQTDLFYRIVPKPFTAKGLLQHVQICIAETRFCRNMQGRRAGERFHVELSMTATIGGRELTVATENISLGGAYVKTDEKVPLGTPIQLTFPHRGQTVVVVATVAHRGRGGLGLSFAEVSEQSRFAIGELISAFLYDRT